MEKQRWEESEKRREEERRSEKRKSQKKEDAGAGKGSKVAIHCAFPMICGSGGSKSRLAKAAGAEPCCQMREEQLHAVVARSTFPSQNAQETHKDQTTFGQAHFQVKTYKAHHSRTTFGSWDIEKVHAVVRSAFRSQMCKKHHILGPVLKVEMWFCVAGARDSAHCQKWAKREGFVAFPKTMAGVGHLKRVWKDAFRVAGAVQETCSSEMLGGQGADFLREVAFWSIRSSGLLRWLCPTGAALRMTWHHFFDAVSSALNFPFLKEVSRNCFVFDVLNFEQWGSLAESLPCWCCQVQIDG